MEEKSDHRRGRNRSKPALLFRVNEELVQLTNTASGEVVFTITQKRPQVDRQTIIGKGKLQELVQQADAHEADLIIFNHELTPRQSQLITDAVGLPVIDRVQLILDILRCVLVRKKGSCRLNLLS